MKNLIDALEDKKPESSIPTEETPTVAEAKSKSKAKAKKKGKKGAPKQDDLDLELGLPQRKNNESEEMQAFFKNVEEVKQAIEFLRGQTKQIVELSDKAVNAIGDRSEKECSNQLDNLIKAANAHASKAKVLLQNMKAANEAPLPNGKKMKDSERRIRRTLHQTLTQKFVQVLRNHQQEQQRYKARMKEKVTRQVRVVKPDATYEEIEDALKSGDHGAVYREAILKPGSDPVAEAFQNVSDKLRDVLALERSVRELHQMFADMLQLIQNQGEMLDKIEFSVNSAEQHVEKGNKELGKALVARKQIRKKYFFLLILFIIIIIIIVASVLGSG